MASGITLLKNLDAGNCRNQTFISQKEKSFTAEVKEFNSFLLVGHTASAYTPEGPAWVWAALTLVRTPWLPSCPPQGLHPGSCLPQEQGADAVLPGDARGTSPVLQ